MTIESLVVNLSGKVRKVRSKGIKYLVAPVRMIVPGVLNGSQGPILYTAKENQASFKRWNGVPLTDGHPRNGSEPLPASKSPHTHMGEVRNAGVDGSDLIAEAWFVDAKTKQVNNKIYAALTQGQKIELSTGLGLSKEAAPEGSVHNGVPYTFIAKNYQPDHLAILSDEVGACSIQDGCGVLNSDESDNDKSSTPDSSKGSSMTPEEKAAIVDGLIANNCGCWTAEDKEVLNSFTDEKLSSLQESQVKNEEKTAVINAATKEFKTEDGTTFTFNSKELVWNSKSPEKEKPKEEEEAVVNKAGQSMTETPQTLDQWMASAPPEVQGVVANSMKIEKQQKESLVRKIIANVSGEEERTSKGDYFMAKSLDDLEAIAEMIPTANVETTNSSRINWSAASGGSEVTANAGANEFGADQFLEEVTLNFSNDTK